MEAAEFAAHAAALAVEEAATAEAAEVAARAAALAAEEAAAVEAAEAEAQAAANEARAAARLQSIFRMNSAKSWYHTMLQAKMEARAQELGPALEEIIEHQQDDWSHEQSVWRDTGRAWITAMDLGERGANHQQHPDGFSGR